MSCLKNLQNQSSFIKIVSDTVNLRFNASDMSTDGSFSLKSCEPLLDPCKEFNLTLFMSFRISIISAKLVDFDRQEVSSSSSMVISCRLFSKSRSKFDEAAMENDAMLKESTGSVSGTSSLSINDAKGGHAASKSGKEQATLDVSGEPSSGVKGADVISILLSGTATILAICSRKRLSSS